ncbi:MAG TPA: S8 family serine peptidase [Candidatus Bathyarchaeia archaeon]|nr:S8 family serine peptidase [Candidatus Bathyarchaeia archaeon]
MKRGKILSLVLLSLFVLSILTPIAITKADLIFNVNHSTRIYQKLITDMNGDKIDDKFTREIERKNEYIINATLTFDHKITSRDRLSLFKLGVTETGEFWDQGRRTLITTTRDNLANVAELNGLVSITSGEKRVIIVGILGDDTSDLDALSIFDGARIYHPVGCAILHYYTGVENDIKLLGDYTLIADTTDSRFYPTVEEVEKVIYTPDLYLSISAQFLNATGMWNLGYDGTGINIGNIDTGINYNHKAISGRVINTQSFVTIENGYSTEDLTITDFNGHGSHTSGIILANDSDSSLNRGMAPDAFLSFAKVGSSATPASIIEAALWLSNIIGVSVINFSYGGTDTPGLDSVEIAFANTVKNENVLICVSAGNEGTSGTYSIGSPGSTADVLTVGALDSVITPIVASYSSLGLTADNCLKPDVLAPGTSIYSLSNIGDGYVYKSGTSMAAPHITGVVALLAEACFANSIDINPGVFKAALMKSCTEIVGTNVLKQGRGYINVGKAWNYILKASRVENIPLLGTLNPISSPISWFETLLQGQVHEQYLTTVCSQKINKTLEVSGDAAQFITVAPFITDWSDIVKVTYTIPVDAIIGHYTGYFNFKFNDTVLETADIAFDVAPSNGKRMLLNFRTTNWGIDHMYGQYAKFSEGILDNEYVLSEQLTYLDTGILANYECVWLADPFSITFPNNDDDDYTTKDTYNPWTESEKDALTDYVANGGSVLIVFNGPTVEDDPEFGLIYGGTNTSTINDWTDQYGIHVTDTIFPESYPIVIGSSNLSPLTFGITGIDHYGTYIDVSGDAVQVSEYTAGTAKAGAATYQDPSGGRVIVVATNFLFDTAGFINSYNPGTTQNDVFALNIVRWATAQHRIQRDCITFDSSGLATLRYNYLMGSGGDFTGYIVKPDSTQANLVFTETSPNIWEAVYNCSYNYGEYAFFVECGITGEDDFDYFITNYGEISPSETSGLSGITSIIIAIITGFGLAGWSLLLRIKGK